MHGFFYSHAILLSIVLCTPPPPPTTRPLLPPNSRSHPIYTANPPLPTCLGSPAASNVPFSHLLTPCAVLCPGATHVTFLPSPLINATVALSYAHSKLVTAGTSWSCSLGAASATATESPPSSTWCSAWIVAVMMREPPAEPVAKRKEEGERDVAMVGEMEERGRALGWMKLEGEGM